MPANRLFTAARKRMPRNLDDIRRAVPRDWNSAKRLLPTFMIVLGAALLIYVGTQYGQMYWEQHQLEREWSDQQQRASQQPEGSQPSTAADDGLTRLTIPKIDLSAVVVEGTSRKKLLLGPGHMKETPAPGTEGNSVITAHRDTFFRHIVELSKGDELLVQRNGRTFTYEVQAKRVVKPEDVSVIKPSKDSRLTLITCYPTYYIGPAPERLVIISRLKEGEAAQANTQGSGPTEMPKDTSESAKQ